MAQQHSTDAESRFTAERIKAAGYRATEARIAVLTTLQSADHALTHHEIEEQLLAQDVRIDRVTLYRVLDWALEQGLAHKVTGDDRIWRFSGAENSEHAHFSCTSCGKVFCLESLSPAVALTLPKGFKLQHADVAVQGVCPDCNAVSNR